MTYLDTDKMRKDQRANPGWSKIAALQGLFGMQATERHLRMAKRSDGPADDDRVKRSIPDQVDRWKLFYERDVAPGFLLTAAQVFPLIQIDEYDNGQALRFTVNEARKKLLPSGMSIDEWLKTAQVFDYWENLYQRTHGRSPDPKGKAFWIHWHETEFLQGMKSGGEDV